MGEISEVGAYNILLCIYCYFRRTSVCIFYVEGTVGTTVDPRFQLLKKPVAFFVDEVQVTIIDKILCLNNDNCAKFNVLKMIIERNLMSKS